VKNLPCVSSSGKQSFPMFSPLAAVVVVSPVAGWLTQDLA